MVDRWARPIPEAPRHVRVIGFAGGTKPLKEDEEVVGFQAHKPELEITQDHANPTAI